MDISQQAEALEQRTEKLKTSFEAERRETSEQVWACLAQAKAPGAGWAT